MEVIKKIKQIYHIMINQKKKDTAEKDKTMGLYTYFIKTI